MSEVEYKVRKKEIKDIVVDVPSKVNVTIDHNKVHFEEGSVKLNISYNPVFITIKLEDNKIIISPKDARKKTRAVLNTTYKLINNVFIGLENEFVYKLAIVYSHFPMTVKVEGNDIVITNFLGEKKPRLTKVLPGCKVEVKGKEIIVSGHDKYATGQTAGNIEKITRVTNKDFRVFDDGCYIIEKPNIKKE